jgi:hypothetical protein
MKEEQTLDKRQKQSIPAFLGYFNSIVSCLLRGFNVGFPLAGASQMPRIK